MSTTWIGDALVGAAKGAAAGSVVPGIGTAIGAAGGLALALAPELGKHLFGPAAAPTIAAVQQAVAAVTGTTDPAAQIAATADPQVAADLRIQLAQIAADRDAAALTDVQDARKQTVALAAAHSGIAWGASAVSLVIAVGFFGAFSLLIFGPDQPDQGRAAMLNILVGTLATAFASVVGYWLGSSAGSARKTEQLAASVPASLLPSPAAVVPAADAGR